MLGFTAELGPSWWVLKRLSAMGLGGAATCERRRAGESVGAGIRLGFLLNAGESWAALFEGAGMLLACLSEAVSSSEASRNMCGETLEMFELLCLREAWLGLGRAGLVGHAEALSIEVGPGGTCTAPCLLQ
jgi:hypothetical protein